MVIAEIRRGYNGREQLGIEIRRWRTQEGIKQGALADSIGISGAFLCEVEAGKRPMSLELLAKLEAML